MFEINNEEIEINFMGQMFYYIDQPCNPFFAIELVKTESDFIVRSVETGLGR